MSAVEESKLPTAKTSPECCGRPLSAWYGTAEKCASEEPVKCAALAFVAGFLFTILPVGQIVGGLMRLLLSLVRPTLVILGVMKVFEEVEKRRKA